MFILSRTYFVKFCLYVKNTLHKNYVIRSLPRFPRFVYLLVPRIQRRKYLSLRFLALFPISYTFYQFWAIYTFVRNNPIYSRVRVFKEVGT